MQIILGLIFIIILAILLSQSKLLTSRGQTVVFALAMMILASAILYEFMFSKTEQQNRDLINAFTQGKSIICKEATVTQENYILERGTLSFMAKSDNKKITGIIYSIEDCSIKE